MWACQRCKYMSGDVHTTCEKCGTRRGSSVHPLAEFSENLRNFKPAPPPAVEAMLTCPQCNRPWSEHTTHTDPPDPEAPGISQTVTCPAVEASGDARHVVIPLSGGRKFEAWIPASADRVDIMNFIEHLQKLANERTS